MGGSTRAGKLNCNAKTPPSMLDGGKFHNKSSSLSRWWPSSTHIRSNCLVPGADSEPVIAGLSLIIQIVGSIGIVVNICSLLCWTLLMRCRFMAATLGQYEFIGRTLRWSLLQQICGVAILFWRLFFLVCHLDSCVSSAIQYAALISWMLMRKRKKKKVNKSSPDCRILVMYSTK